MGFLNLNDSNKLRPLNLTLNSIATHIIRYEVYVCHFGWFFALLLVITAMLGATLVGAFYSYQICQGRQ